MGANYSKSTKDWRDYCLSHQVFSKYGFMERRVNEETGVEYYITLREFVEEVIELVFDDMEKTSSFDVPTMRNCEKEAVIFIIAVLSPFWRSYFPFKGEVKFDDIVAAYKLFDKEEHGWINEKEPFTPLYNDAPTLKSVIVAPAGSIKVTVTKEEEEEEDDDQMVICIESDDSLDIPDEADSICLKCQQSGHLADMCTGKRSNRFLKESAKKPEIGSYS